MNLRTLQLKIEEINNDLPNINYGGCGTFSYHLKKVLYEKYDMKSDIYYIPGDPAAIHYDILFSHILLKVDDCIIDNNGFYNTNSPWVKDLIPLSDTKLKEMIEIPELWNSEFHNDENINKLINKINTI
jgi:hypothetical protein